MKNLVDPGSLEKLDMEKSVSGNGKNEKAYEDNVQRK